jgi:hypothetical protein
MATYSTSQFKNGLKLMLGGNPCSIISNEIRKPGKDYVQHYPILLAFLTKIMLIFYGGFLMMVVLSALILILTMKT